LWVGQVVVSTSESNAAIVHSAILDLGLNLQITLNMKSLMVLPVGVSKASGLRGALAQLGLSPFDCVGVGDAENDLAFLDVCGLPVAVANALPSVKGRAAFVTTGARGAGVAELIDQLLTTDLAEFTAIRERGKPLLSMSNEGGSYNRQRDQSRRSLRHATKCR
jgi:hydroxymethylpyrimidine pyrophosphatase-like HAD family hydrolase